MKRKAILIAGPTASGKSGAAIGIAAATGGVIVNADSMQVYRNLQVLTSRPTARDEARAPHRLYGYMDAGVACSTGMWLNDLAKVLADIWAAGKTAILVGGTGLYFRSALEGLAEVPEIPLEVRNKWRDRLAAQGAEALHGVLSKLDSTEAARFEPGDGQRIVRALEVLEATGKPLSWFHRKARHSAVLAGADVQKIVVRPARDVLYERINSRFDEMMKEGALEEARALLALGLPEDLPAMKAIGVRALGEYLGGRCSLEDATETAKRETRNYAKRQMTWVRGQMADWTMVDTARGAIALVCDEAGKSYGPGQRLAP